MMSQIVTSIRTWTSCSGWYRDSSFFDTFVPIVVMYRSSNMFRTYRRIREVFPTAFSPTRHTFTLNCFWAVIKRSSREAGAVSGPSLPWILKGWRAVSEIETVCGNHATSARLRIAFPRARNVSSTRSPVFALV